MLDFCLRTFKMLLSKISHSVHSCGNFVALLLEMHFKAHGVLWGQQVCMQRRGVHKKKYPNTSAWGSVSGDLTAEFLVIMGIYFFFKKNLK